MYDIPTRRKSRLGSFGGIQKPRSIMRMSLSYERHSSRILCSQEHRHVGLQGGSNLFTLQDLRGSNSSSIVEIEPIGATSVKPFPSQPSCHAPTSLYHRANWTMPSDTWDGKEEDDFGMPIRRSGGATARTSTSLPRRLRQYSPFLALLVLGLLYWNWPQSLTRVDWSRFAYVQYATDDHNLCNALMVFESLHRHGAKAQKVLLHNPQWASTSEGGADRNSQLLSIAEKKYQVRLKPVRLIDERGEETMGFGSGGGGSSWDTSITKLRAFELEEYDRVLHLDSDITLFDSLDELFQLPQTPVAMPRAYWTDSPSPGQWPLTSMLVLLQPDRRELQGMLATLRSWWIESKQTMSGVKQYDMELLNHRFGSSALILPHRPYALLSAEFRRPHHEAYLGTINAPADVKVKQKWNPDAVLKEAKLVHFSDWPLPKPWIMWPHDGLVEIQPNCTELHDDHTFTCRERDVWKELYDDYRRRRKDICRLLSVAAPDWNKQKAAAGAT
jgi:hypothetical protein